MNIHPPQIVPRPPPDDELAGIGTLTPTAQAILRHICTGPAACRAVARVADWCDAEDDRDHLVLCPGCGRGFAASEVDLAELRTWTNGSGQPFACGVKWE